MAAPPRAPNGSAPAAGIERRLRWEGFDRGRETEPGMVGWEASRQARADPVAEEGAMAGNEAVRAQVVMAMRRPGAVIGPSDALVMAVVRRVLGALGFEQADGEEGALPASADEIETRLESSGELIARHTAPMAERIQALDAVAVCAERYRRAVRRGKHKKAARTKLFDAVAAWKESPQPHAGRPTDSG
jgi:hypothetical protein